MIALTISVGWVVANYLNGKMIMFGQPNTDSLKKFDLSKPGDGMRHLANTIAEMLIKPQSGSVTDHLDRSGAYYKDVELKSFNESNRQKIQDRIYDQLAMNQQELSLIPVNVEIELDGYINFLPRLASCKSYYLKANA